MPAIRQNQVDTPQSPEGTRGARARNALYELGLAVARSRSPEQIYEASLDCLDESLAVSRAAVLLFDERLVMRFVASRGLSETYRKAVEGHNPWAAGTADPQPVLVPDTAADPELLPLRPVLRKEGIAAVAFIPLCVDGELLGKFMLYYAAPHAFEEEEVAIVQGIAAHVGLALQSERSRREIRRSEMRYRDLVQSIGVPIYTTDAKGHIEQFNQAAVTLWGRAPVLDEELWCGSWKLFETDGTPMDHSDCPMAITLKEDREVRGTEIVAERPDGTRATILPFPTPLHDPSGKLIGAVNVLADITEQKRTQEALLEALRAKDDFLGQISHELRNPVTQIAGYSQLLASRFRDLPSEIQEESLEGIHAQAIRLQRLVENMLVLSRFERGVPPVSEPQLIQRLVAETVNEFRRRFPRTRLEVEIEASLPPVDVSASTIDQVVWNLLTNAQKYGKPGGPVQLRCVLRDGSVEITVLDQGAGVSEGELSKLFQPYYRAEGTPVQIHGLGLGLSVCKRLVEAEQGELWARRREVEGMEFGLRFRAVEISGIED